MNFHLIFTELAPPADLGDVHQVLLIEGLVVQRFAQYHVLPLRDARGVEGAESFQDQGSREQPLNLSLGLSVLPIYQYGIYRYVIFRTGISESQMRICVYTE